jgi:hypothetical protein
MRRVELLSWLLGVTLLLAGCGGQRREVDLLEETLERYAHAIRWFGFDRAPEFLDEARQRELAERPLLLERLKQYEVAGYRLRSPPVVGEGRAVQTVEIDLVHRHTQTFSQILDRQEWRFDRERMRWLRTNPLPEPRAPR